jgi:lysophospholipase L1-like esterase
LLTSVIVIGCSSAGTGVPSASTAPPSAPSASASASAPSASPSAASASPAAGLSLVVVGDSIAFNSAEDCPGCTAFVQTYADALAEATGKSVRLQNRSEHNSLTISRLLTEVKNDRQRIDALTGADAIIVGIAHNDVPMNRDDDACDGPFSETPDWSKFTDECLATEIDRFAPLYRETYERIAAFRAGKPTILRTINRYNDWIGWPGHDLPPAGIEATARVIKAWNAVICGAAQDNGFECVDVSTRFNGPDGTEASGPLLAADYTHPSAEGNAAIAELLIDSGFAPLIP